MNIDLNEWRARMILESFVALDEKWSVVIDGTEDVDVKADYGNDLMMLHSLQESFEKRAVQEFGRGITDFSREPVQNSTHSSGTDAQKE